MALDLQVWALHMLEKFRDEVSVEVGYLLVLVLSDS